MFSTIFNVIHMYMEMYSRSERIKAFLDKKKKEKKKYLLFMILISIVQ